MKNLSKYIFVLLITITFIACSDEPPSFRVSNEAPAKVNMQIKTVSNTININDVQPAQITSYRDVPEGNVEITAEIQGAVDEPTGSFQAENNVNYTIVVVNSNPPILRIDRSDK